MSKNITLSCFKLTGCSSINVVGRLLCSSVLMVVFLFACGGASAGNRDILRSDVLLLKQENRRLREEMTNLDSLVKSRLQNLDRFNANFGADVRQLNERMSIIEQRLADIEQKLARSSRGRQSASSVVEQSQSGSAQLQQIRPREIFDLAYKDYTAAHYQIAIDGFHDFLKKFPDSPLAPEAYLYIGDSYRSLNKYREAVAQYKIIIDRYQDSPLQPDALYKIGDCLIVSGDRSRGELFLQALIQKFPDSKAAALARAKLNP
jgi:tol-pal system protein YbgF